MAETNPTSAKKPPIFPPGNEIDLELQKYHDAFNIREIVIGENQVFHTVALNLSYLVKTFCPDVDESTISSLIKDIEDADSKLELYRLDTGDDHSLRAETRQKFQEQFDKANAQLQAHGVDYDLYKRAKKMKQREASRLNEKFNAEDYT